jgi:hypothetical protein
MEFLSPGQSPLLEQSPVFQNPLPPAIVDVIRCHVSLCFLIPAAVELFDELPDLLP